MVHSQLTSYIWSCVIAWYNKYKSCSELVKYIPPDSSIDFYRSQTWFRCVSMIFYVEIDHNFEWLLTWSHLIIDHVSPSDIMGTNPVQSLSNTSPQTHLLIRNKAYMYFDIWHSTQHWTIIIDHVWLWDHLHDFTSRLN